jgi:hypothetical protein
MPIPTYTPGYPPDGASLGQTKSTIRNNLDGTFETVAVDHVNNNGQPGSNPAGYHTIIHEVTQTNVVTVASHNQVFSGVPGTLVVNAVTTPTIPPGGDTQLYSLSASGILSQLTGRVAMQSGYCWLSGVLLQWGRNGVTGTNTPVTFPVAFPTAVFSCVASPAVGDRFGGVINLSTTGFTFNETNATGNFYWFVIGN